MTTTRIAVGVASASAILFAALTNSEYFVPTAIQPVPGDKWTYGIGSTTKEDGTPVQPGDTIKPTQAIRLAVKDMSKKEKRLKECFSGAELFPYEWDAMVDLSYNVGPEAVCSSSLPKKAKAREYKAMCDTILDFYKVQKRDCRAPENKRFCGGVWTRRQEMREVCLHGWPSA